MRKILALAVALNLVVACSGQSRREMDRPVRQAVRGVHAGVVAGSEYATEAGMRTYYKGGNAVDIGVATMFAASVTELSHFGLGGEAPILIRTKAGKVFAIAGVGTMPKLATAEMFRTRRLMPFEILEMDPGGLKGIIPVAGLMPALVPGMVDAGLLALREFGTKSFNEVIAPAIELADGFAIDQMRAQSIAGSRPFFDAVADFEGALHAGRPHAERRRDFPPAGYGADSARDGGGGEEGARGGRKTRGGDRRGARLFLSRRDREEDRRVQQSEQGSASLRRYGRVQA